MGACGRNGGFMGIVLAAFLHASAVPSVAFASGKDGDAPPAKTKTEAGKPGATKVDAPAPLTERERRMLDRMEELEKRVAELEAKGQPAAPSSTETTTSKPAAVSPPTATGIAGTAGSGEVANAVSPAGAVSAAPGTQEKATTRPAKAEPFTFADFTWLNGNARTKQPAMDTKFFTPEIRVDAGYVYDFNHPKDDTIGGSAEVFRAQEFNLTQLGVGGDFHYDNVRGRVMTQFGMYSQTQPRNDASPTRGQWGLDGAYRYLAEAYGGYHFNAMHGINVDAGIFMSYIGLFSWYNFDNWAYQPSYVSSNTPFFFNGLRVQFYPTAKLKIEPWLINGWQSYGRFNNRLGVGFQIAYRPTGSIAIVSNGYMLGEDTLNVPGRIRYHSDSTIQIKYYDKPDNFLDKMAFSLTGDIGCEHGGGVSCAGYSAKGPKQSFLGFMLYNRLWFNRDKYGLTIGGGRINNPGRYLVLIPPINGASAASGTPYFTANPGDPFKAWDMSGTFDWMPSQYITFRTEFDHRAASVPYFSGPGGITPTSCPSAPLVSNICGTPGALVPGFTPDLRKIENRIDLSILVKF
jgi:Putative beta-barrel porin-2, OmpL-like. bbp2